MKLLLTGPPASGKTRVALDHFLSRPGSLLLVPTATMAEHLRHQLARAGAAVRPSAIQTIGAFVDEWASSAAAPLPLLHLLIEQALASLRPRRFAGVADLPGFITALARTLADTLPPYAPDEIRRLRASVGEELHARGMAWREDRLAQAGDRAPAREVVLDGFFRLSDAETAFVLALAARAPVTATLPAWAGAEATREALLAAGFEERLLEGPRRVARRTGFSTPTIEQEATAIAARIRDEAEHGRPFREMGIVLRVRDPYGPLLDTTLARHGIPARFYFTDPAASHPAVDYLVRMVRAWISGWDHAVLLPALRMPVSGLGATPAGDALDFTMRKSLPDGAGLPVASPPLESLQSANALRSPAEWAAHLRVLRALIPMPEADGATRERVNAWRSTAAAVRMFDEALDASAEACGANPCALAAFWRQVETTLALEPLRVPDPRRDVVHVMDVHEARQWELPLVFVCGLTERHFPQYHVADPILRDSAALAARQMEEPFLFEIATSRATAETVLSYPRFDENGAETLPSFFLDGAALPAAPLADARGSVLTAEPNTGVAPAPVVHHTLSPSAIESFLQCPFQFFGRHTLRLKERPKEPRDRLDVLLQGSILHQALAELAETPLLGAAVLDRVFEEECAKHHVPLTYRAEAVRLELLRHFCAFLDDEQVRLTGWSTQVEQKFTYALNPSLSIRGRIDRLETSPDGRALVIDYKYSMGGRIREQVKRAEAGEQVQGGLYLAAAERAFGLRPAGMFYCGLKKGVNWQGWHVSIDGLHDIGERRTEDTLRELIRSAELSALAVHEAIAQGRIAPQPADRDRCAWCDFVDICRIESTAAARGAG